MKLKEGQFAKSFSINDSIGNYISLDYYKGKKLLLSFYRYAACPLCNLRISKLIKFYPSLSEWGLSILAFFESSNESIYNNVGNQNPPFPLVGDPELKIYKLYGVETSMFGYIRGGMNFFKFYEAAKKGFLPGKSDGLKTLIPADFLIGRDQRIVKAYYGKNIGDHIPITTIQKFLE